MAGASLLPCKNERLIIMGKIKIIKGCVLNGRAMQVGEIVESTEQDALLLIALGKAIVAPVVKVEKKSKPKGKK